jgi:RNA polymerase sigma-70 factor, ECF subfamily
MTRYARGEDAALGDVYDLASPAIFAFLVRLCRERAAAEDLTHETFLRIHRARASYREGAEVLPWAYAIARRLFLDNVRSRKREGPSLDEQRDSGTSFSSTLQAEGAAQDDEVAGHQLSAAIEKVLGTLPETQASAFRLLKQEGLSVADAAAVLGVTETSVKLRAHRAYEALREALGKDWDVPVKGGK